MKIFNSIKIRELTPTWRKKSDKLEKVQVTKDSKGSPQQLDVG